MGRVGRSALKCSNNQHVRMKNMDSEDSDEDYVAEVDDVSDELDSFVGNASEEESCFEEDDNEEEEKEEEDEDFEEDEEEEDDEEEVEEEDDDEEEEEWRTVVKPKGPKRSARSRKNGIKKIRKKRRKVVCSDSDDDDDEEFTPDEIDSLEEEEEFSSPKRKTKKRKRTTVRRKSSVRRRRRKTRANAVKKSVRKKSKKSGNLRRKADSCDDEDFSDSGPTLRGGGKKKPVRKKRRVKSGSDSEFCSDPSDYEFTISEEEREQIREANALCRGLTPSLRSSKRLQEDEVICEVRKHPARKGKEKAEEKKTDVGKPVCGICLTEEGKNTIRGTLNCCNHYFCFACIMEWSKVESRCPLCKQRFITISKPARCVKGFGLRDSVIQIPERDQVYQPSEEELRDFLNPYENVICTECHHGGDDDLMLLCDVCDSPAHTYCVGLGREVPDGNWYCDGCRPVALGSSQSLPQDLTPDRRTNIHSPYGSSTYENMSEIDLNVSIPETPVSQANGFLPSPRYAGGSFQASPPVSGTGVSTVFGRRRIQNQIRALLSSRLASTPTGAHLDPLRSLLGVDSTFQQSRTDVGSSHHAVHGVTLQDNPFYDVQNRDFISERTNYIVGQVSQASTSNGSANSQMQWNGLDRMNFGAGQTQILGDEQLRRCISQPNVGFDIGSSLMNHQVEDHNSLVKQRVHSIVNSQLLNMSRDLNLSLDDHRTILGGAIDAIMVAFEREPTRLGIHQEHEPRPHCGHVDGLSDVEISPMSECCLACFENFARHTLKKMMNVRLGPPYWRRLRY